MQAIQAKVAESENLAVYSESTDFERYAAPIALVERNSALTSRAVRLGADCGE
jgi:hypothetical protein